MVDELDGLCIKYQSDTDYPRQAFRVDYPQGVTARLNGACLVALKDISACGFAVEEVGPWRQGQTVQVDLIQDGEVRFRQLAAQVVRVGERTTAFRFLHSHWRAEAALDGFILELEKAAIARRKAQTEDG
ncbi:MAG: PilZ domain-containing protein [Desulfomicrobiaceae bacterium]|nr:PilZ domain-containing protein [Desulfomicrobiaceae bacterium]